jgi:GNAT superfamily N-acetyltransferase
MKTITIEAIKVEEVEAVSRLVIDSVRKGLAGFYRPSVIEALASGNSPAAIAGHAPKQINYCLYRQGKEKLLGMVGLKRNEIGHLFVDPTEYGNGLGRQLINFARQKFKDAGYSQMLVLSSLNAIDFYSHFGFTEQDRGSFSVGDDLKLDYVRMTCELA